LQLQFLISNLILNFCKRIIMKKIFLLLLISINISVFPQNQNTNQNSDSTNIELNLNPIIISATRFPERITEIPFAATIITDEKFFGKKGYNIDEVLSTVPGVLAQSRYGVQDIRITIRGFGARGSGDRSNAGTSRGIRVLHNGFPITEPDGRTSFDQIDFNLENNVEVVRSNVSSIWGNAGGGIVNISTIPNNENSFYDFSGAAGSFGFLYSNVRLNNKISGGNIYASFSSSKINGWREHSNSSRSIFNAAVQSNLNQKTSIGIYLSGTSNIFHIPGPLTQKQFNSSPEKVIKIMLLLI